jgi:hypothetical protein
MLLAQILHDIKHKKDNFQFSNTPDFYTFFRTFGTVVFAFGGHPALPTIQTNMEDKTKFKWAVIIGYLGKYIFPSICLLWAFIRRFLIGKQDLYTYDNFSVTKSKYIMYTFQGYRFFYNNSVHTVICGSWYFTHKRKALP